MGVILRYLLELIKFNGNKIDKSAMKDCLSYIQMALSCVDDLYKGLLNYPNNDNSAILAIITELQIIKKYLEEMEKIESKFICESDSVSAVHFNRLSEDVVHLSTGFEHMIKIYDQLLKRYTNNKKQALQDFGHTFKSQNENFLTSYQNLTQQLEDSIKAIREFQTTLETTLRTLKDKIEKKHKYVSITIKNKNKGIFRYILLDVLDYNNVPLLALIEPKLKVARPTGYLVEHTDDEASLSNIRHINYDIGELNVHVFENTPEARRYEEKVIRKAV
ncbi:MAG: hypothetical protein ACMXYC_00995 [Candidatus Woesearchaeota archaeon]